MWNHSGTGAYPGDWERTAQVLADNGLNMILPNMLWGGVAHYASDVLPRSKTFEQYGDQIAQCVEAAHRHGLQVHVWKVDWNLGHECPPEFIEKLRREKRLMASATGEEVLWLCPSNPENHKLELESLLEVARKYPVDGLPLRLHPLPGRQRVLLRRLPRAVRAGVGPQGGRVAGGVLLRGSERGIRPVALRPDHQAGGGRASRGQASAARDQAVGGRVRVVSGLQEVGGPGLGAVGAVGLPGLPLPDGLHRQRRAVLPAGREPVAPGGGQDSRLSGHRATASRVTLTSDRVAGEVFHARRLGAAGFTIFNLSQMTAEGIVPALHLGVSAEKATPPH